MPLKPPRLPDAHPDRQIELEEELEAQLVAIMDMARDTGWHQEEIAEAVISLARNYVARLDADAETERQIAAARRTVQH